MPPRTAATTAAVSVLTGSFSLEDNNNEVVCPLRNQDGSSCRKRCVGDKRYRSMQEHIRRAHPEYYISKLPATEESFNLMTRTPPNADRKPPTSAPSSNQAPTSTPSSMNGHSSLFPAAAALAQLRRTEHDWDSDGWHSDSDARNYQLPPIQASHDMLPSGPLPSLTGQGKGLPSFLSGSPPGRSSTLPPLQRSLNSAIRKPAVNKRLTPHKRQRSKGAHNDWLRRVQNFDDYGRDRKALSAEPSSDFGKRWEDLIDAASMAGDMDDERTPMPRSPVSMSRASLPPYNNNNQGLPPSSQPQPVYQNSPLQQQQALTPPSYIAESSEPFPSVESNDGSDHSFGQRHHHTATPNSNHVQPHPQHPHHPHHSYHPHSQGPQQQQQQPPSSFGPQAQSTASDASPTATSTTTPATPQAVQIYCAACHNLAYLKESYACTECITGLCHLCVEVLMQEQGARRKCPRCLTIGGRFKPFQLDLR